MDARRSPPRRMTSRVPAAVQIPSNSCHTPLLFDEGLSACGDPTHAVRTTRLIIATIAKRESRRYTAPAAVDQTNVPLPFLIPQCFRELWDGARTISCR